MEATVQISGMSHVYVSDDQANMALEDVQLTVHPGEFVSLLGPSGCGKTTLLSIIAGLIQPTQGEVRINGKSITSPTPEVGYMLQQDYLFPWRTIYDNSIIGLQLLGRLNMETEAYVAHLLEEMGLSRYRTYRPSQLSGGMRQRVALVRTLATEPELLLLDEPFSALDYQTKLQLEDLVIQTLHDRDKTAILVTHDITEAIAMSDRIILLEPRPGRIRREIVIPEEIRRTLPLQAREIPGFHELFRDIWREFELMGGKGEEAGR
ncbi:ABC transporter ATP-binding protein [Paenibacillus lutrae]|nr:ABC transporter ATP-binding protein [Paenibacillus lutrae]